MVWTCPVERAEYRAHYTIRCSCNLPLSLSPSVAASWARAGLMGNKLTALFCPIVARSRDSRPEQRRDTSIHCSHSLCRHLASKCTADQRKSIQIGNPIYVFYNSISYLLSATAHPHPSSLGRTTRHRRESRLTIKTSSTASLHPQPLRPVPLESVSSSSLARLSSFALLGLLVSYARGPEHPLRGLGVCCLRCFGTRGICSSLV